MVIKFYKRFIYFFIDSPLGTYLKIEGEGYNIQI